MSMQPVDILPFSFFEWCQSTWISHWINKQQWVFAVTETIHIIAFSILLGTTLSVDLRLLGYGLKRQPSSRIARELEPWTWVTLVVTAFTGVMMFLTEAEHLSISASFFFKMVFFVCAIALHVTIHRKATLPGAIESAWTGKVAAYLSLACWLGVALAGRAIAFL